MSLVAIYESFLKDLQSAKVMPVSSIHRAVTDFMVKVVKPVLGDKIGILPHTCGTGGFF